MDILHFLLSVTFVSWVFDEKKRKTHQETKGRNRWKKMRCQLPKDNERQWEVDIGSSFISGQRKNTNKPTKRDVGVGCILPLSSANEKKEDPEGENEERQAIKEANRERPKTSRAERTQDRPLYLFI